MPSLTLLLKRVGVVFVFFVVLLGGGAGCSRGEMKFDRVVLNERASVPVLEANEVSTLISDSGITRYRINAPQ